MAEGFEETLAEEVPDWVEAGIVTRQQGQAILERYDVTAGRSRRGAGSTSWTTSLLYGTASILLGAAAVAFILVGIDPAEPQIPLLFTGLIVSGLGALGAIALPTDRRLLGETLVGAGLVPLAASVFPEDAWGPLVGAIIVPAALLVWKRHHAFLPTFSVIAFAVGSGGGFFSVIETEANAAMVWMASQLVLVAGLLAIDRFLREEDGVVHVALAVGALAISLIPYLDTALDVSSSETIELILGGVMALLLGAGVVLRHRGLLAGAATALGIDAIVFAFDVGGPWTGTGLLVVLALVLIWQAEALKHVLSGEPERA